MYIRQSRINRQILRQLEFPKTKPGRNIKYEQMK